VVLEIEPVLLRFVVWEEVEVVLIRLRIGSASATLVKRPNMISPPVLKAVVKNRVCDGLGPAIGHIRSLS
jgi:hypothetical protein